MKRQVTFWRKAPFFENKSYRRKWFLEHNLLSRLFIHGKTLELILLQYRLSHPVSVHYRISIPISKPCPLFKKVCLTEPKKSQKSPPRIFIRCETLEPELLHYRRSLSTLIHYQKLFCIPISSPTTKKRTTDNLNQVAGDPKTPDSSQLGWRPHLEFACSQRAIAYLNTCRRIHSSVWSTHLSTSNLSYKNFY